MDTRVYVLLFELENTMKPWWGRGGLKVCCLINNKKSTHISGEMFQNQPFSFRLYPIIRYCINTIKQEQLKQKRV